MRAETYELHDTIPVAETAPLPTLLADRASRGGRPAVIAHRGNSSVAPQNTLAAFEAAWRAGADAISLDVHLTADRRVVVIHDDTLDGTTDRTGRVADLSFDTFRDADAGVAFSRAYAGQRVPEFDDVLRLVAEWRGVDLLVELKGYWSADDVRLVTDAVDRAGLAGRIVIESSWPPTLDALREVAPHLPRAILLGLRPATTKELLAVCSDLDIALCNPAARLVVDDRNISDALHAAGVRVMAWTANDPALWSCLACIGVDGLITDRPDRLFGWWSGAHG